MGGRRPRARTLAVDDVLEPTELREHQLGQRHAGGVRAARALELVLVLGEALEELACKLGLQRVALQQQADERVLDAIARVQ